MGKLVGILEYHVLGAQVLSTDLKNGEKAKTLEGDSVTVGISSAGVKINDARVLKADVKGSNGVIHVIDTVLLPPAPELYQSNTIVDIAVSDPEFSTLVAALKAADLVGTLSGTGPFTVFAPTNAAFKKLPAGTLESLLKPENKAKLVGILEYHVLGAQVLSTDLKNGEKAKTLEGDSVTVGISSAGVKINDARVLKADVKGSN